MQQSLAILTDLYQLTMVQGYWKLAKHQQRAIFDLFFRNHPFEGGYTICCGLGTLLKTLNLSVQYPVIIQEVN